MKKEIVKHNSFIERKENPQKWEKAWDKQFGKANLNEIAVETLGRVFTLNHFAKEFIRSEIMKAENRVIQQHNLMVIAYECEERTRPKKVWGILPIIKSLEHNIDSSKLMIKRLKDIKKDL